MATVADWCSGRLFAATEEHDLVFLCDVLDRCPAGALMAAIAKWLIAAQAAAAPEIGLALLDLKREGGTAGDFRLVCVV